MIWGFLGIQYEEDVEGEGGSEFVFLVSFLLNNRGASPVVESIAEVGSGGIFDREQ